MASASLIVATGSECDRADDFAEGHMRAFDRDPQVFFRTPKSEFLARYCSLAMIEVGGRIVSGARAVIEGGGDSIYIGQVFSEPEFCGRGFAKTTTAALRIKYFLDNNITKASLVVRRIGEVESPAALAAYRAAGFEAHEIRPVPIAPDDPSSRHLLKTANRDGTFDVRVMRATGASLGLCWKLVEPFALQAGAA